MPLQPVATVPDAMAGEVRGVRGRLLVALSKPGDLLTLLAAPGGSDVIELDAAAVAELQALLADAAARMAGG